MASIQRIVSPLTKSISYRVQVRAKGRPAQSETFPNLKEAKAWASCRIGDPRGSAFPSHGSRTMLRGIGATLPRYGGRPRLQQGRSRAASGLVDRPLYGPHAGGDHARLVAEARDALAAETFRRGKVQKKEGIEVPPAEYTRSGST